MLQVTDLTKIYNRLVANDHLNFTVNPGEIAVLLGPNGAGKSTAIEMHRGPFAFPGKYHDLAAIQTRAWRPKRSSAISRRCRRCLRR